MATPPPSSWDPLQQEASLRTDAVMLESCGAGQASPPQSSSSTQQENNDTLRLLREYLNTIYRAIDHSPQEMLDFLQFAELSSWADCDGDSLQALADNMNLLPTSTTTVPEEDPGVLAHQRQTPSVVTTVADLENHFVVPVDSANNADQGQNL